MVPSVRSITCRSHREACCKIPTPPRSRYTVVCYSGCKKGEEAKPVIDKCIEQHQGLPGSIVKVYVSRNGLADLDFLKAKLSQRYRDAVVRAETLAASQNEFHGELVQLFASGIRTLHLVYSRHKPKLFGSVDEYNGKLQGKLSSWANNRPHYNFQHIHHHPC